ncbi:enoyl-CoA hydratase/isomerase family protein [Arthrobacter sp. OY3WO11]|uniref:enoyl-CoA hydratase/isomerase family protein n=1 Tax=Arthrobacter sp. OY3WO11 TaxID=1835723 RepID=UPI000AC5C163|nr:enoyl-CoA hydratase/isomerase family protein [Arthrobacter sp. OY3WO11]
MPSGLIIEKHENGHVLEVVLDRGERGNALSASMYRGLARVIRDAENDASIGALLIRSSCETFCMGGDIADDRGRRDPDYSAAIRDFAEQWLSRSIPTVALVDGGAQAFGCALALSSDLVFSTEKAWFSLPELMHGLVPVYALAVLNASGHASTGARLMWQGKRFSSRDVSSFANNVVLCASTQEAEEGIANTFNGWMGGNVVSLRHAKKFLNNENDTDRQKILSGAHEELQRALADADEDPKKAQSYLSGQH